ncbi:MAG: pyruvoyl-dependent arginine decarboxylase [Candidatus Aenigmarchaeota archaeon]|nr:pyruvoyl-dependent arginine decarboxylase [Candidatus Aenigmarchaeota archaeon]
MKIYINSGEGEGPTRKAAFDNALWKIGIANYNIIPLSSIIPEGSEILEEKIDWNDREHGHRLYVVMAESYAESPGENAAAGIGWIWEERENGKGIFVEIVGKSREEVSEDIKKSLLSMASYRPEKYGDPNIRISETECRSDVACALVVAVYKSEGWE